MCPNFHTVFSWETFQSWPLPGIWHRSWMDISLGKGELGQLAVSVLFHLTEVTGSLSWTAAIQLSCHKQIPDLHNSFSTTWPASRLYEGFGESKTPWVFWFITLHVWIIDTERLPNIHRSHFMLCMPGSAWTPEALGYTWQRYHPCIIRQSLQGKSSKQQKSRALKKFKSITIRQLCRYSVQMQYGMKWNEMSDLYVPYLHAKYVGCQQHTCILISNHVLLCAMCASMSVSTDQFHERDGTTAGFVLFQRNMSDFSADSGWMLGVLTDSEHWPGSLLENTSRLSASSWVFIRFRLSWESAWDHRYSRFDIYVCIF